MRWLAAAPLFALGLLIGLYGVLALTYNEGEGSENYVSLGGRHLDADLVGVVSLVAGPAIIAAGIALVRQRRTRQ